MTPRSSSLGTSKASVRAKSAILHPVETVHRIGGRIEIAREAGARRYDETDGWERRLHIVLGAPWPCPDRAGFDERWQSLSEALSNLGWGHDADPVFARVVGCVVLHARPAKVVELGVGRGVTTRFILQAMATYDDGALWSIDLPPLLEGWRSSVAEAVPPDMRRGWTYVRGASRTKLPRLLRQLQEIDLFVHDSLHTAPTVARDLSRAWPRVRPGGVLLVDGIQRSDAFGVFTSAHPGETHLIGAHEQKDGWLGIMVKGSAGAGGHPYPNEPRVS